jgi:hypothetical protein
MDSFTREMVEEASTKTLYPPLPAQVIDRLPAVLQEATDAFWDVIGRLMAECDISGDDLGWSGFDEWPSHVTEWVVELLAGNVKLGSRETLGRARLQPYVCTVLVRMPADDGHNTRPEDVTALLDEHDVDVISWHYEDLIGEEA